MSENVTYITHRLIRNAVNALSETDAQLAELEAKYQKLIEFVKHVRKRSCSLIDGIDCLSCKALDVLRDIGEDK